MTQIVETPSYKLRDGALLDMLEDALPEGPRNWQTGDLTEALEEPTRQLAGAITHDLPAMVTLEALDGVTKAIGRIDAHNRKNARAALARGLRGVIETALRPALETMGKGDRPGCKGESGGHYTRTCGYRAGYWVAGQPYCKRHGERAQDRIPKAAIRAAAAGLTYTVGDETRKARDPFEYTWPSGDNAAGRWRLLREIIAIGEILVPASVRQGRWNAELEAWGYEWGEIPAAVE